MKKTVLILLFLSLFSLSANADIINPRIKTVCIDKTGKIVVCPQNHYQPNEKTLIKYSELVMSKDECRSKLADEILKAENEGRYPNELKIQQAKCENKYLMGFKDKNGKIVIKPQFDLFRGIGNIFSDETLAVRKEGKWGIIYRNGNWKIKPQYDLLLNYSEGLAGACLNGKCGYIDEKGNWAIKPQDISFMCYIKTNDGEYFYLPCGTSSLFSEGLASVRYDNNTKSGYIDKKGKVVLENISGGVFSQGLAPARKENSNLYGYINKKGEFVIKPQFYEAGSFDKDGIARVEVDKTQKELNVEHKNLIEHYTKLINKLINEAETKEEKQKLKQNLENFKKYSKQEYNIKSDNGFMDNYAYADLITDNDKPKENGKTNIIFSIVLFFLIVVAGVSIKRTVKNNAEH